MTAAAQVLIVEDEPVTRDAYARALAADGHNVRLAAGAQACRAALRAAPSDIVILDLGLPDAGDDLLALARDLCAENDLDVIIVTMRDSIDTRIAALDLGAGDYLLKPVDVGELAARVRRLHRRMQAGRGRRYRIAAWLIDVERRAVTHDKTGALSLTRGEFDLLLKLIEAQGKIVSRERLSDAVSRGAGDLRSVDALVSRLRRKFGEELGAAMIVTAPGFGYRLGAPAEPA